LDAIVVESPVPASLARQIKIAQDRLNQLKAMPPHVQLNHVAVVEQVQHRVNTHMVAADSFHNCSQLIDRVFTAASRTAEELKKPAPKRASIKQYTDAVHVMYRNIYNKELFDCSTFDWVRDDYQKVVNFILSHYKTLNSRSAAFNKLTALLKHLDEYQDVYRKLTGFNSRLAQERDGKAKKNLLSAKELENILPWNQILDAGIGDKIDVLSPTEKIIYLMYTSIPRRLDYRLMKVVSTSIDPNKKKDDFAKFVKALDKDYNYVVMKGGKPVRFVFCRFKTDKHYKNPQVFPLENSKLVSAIKTYISDGGIVDGDFLFGREYSSAVFSKMVKNVFKKLTGKAINVNLLRHSFVSFHSKKNLSEEQIGKLAYKLAHSTGMFRMYNKLNLTDAERAAIDDDGEE